MKTFTREITESRYPTTAIHLAELRTPQSMTELIDMKLLGSALHNDSFVTTDLGLTELAKQHGITEGFDPEEFIKDYCKQRQFSYAKTKRGTVISFIIPTT